VILSIETGLRNRSGAALNTLLKSRRGRKKIVGLQTYRETIHALLHQQGSYLSKGNIPINTSKVPKGNFTGNLTTLPGKQS
jgi:hypothetical protein